MKEEKIQIEKFSISKINTFDTCNKKYKYQYIDKITKEEKLHLNLVNGSTIHNLIEYYLRVIQEDGAIDLGNFYVKFFEFLYKNSVKSYFWNQREDFNFDGDSLYEMLENVSDRNILIVKFNKEYSLLLENLSTKYTGKSMKSLKDENFYEEEYYTQGLDNYLCNIRDTFESILLALIELNSNLGINDTLKSEAIFTSKFKNIILQGFFDVFSYDVEKKEGLIVEIKTSSTTVKSLNEEHINQILMYKKLFKDVIKNKYKHKDIKIHYYMLYITVLKTQTNISFINVDEVEDNNFDVELKDKLKLIKTCTKNNIFVTQKGKHCSYCSYKKLCLPFIKEEEEDEDGN
jgi:CRISPR/Cas system-associated exonuclease Cas4 (RecB family)